MEHCWTPEEARKFLETAGTFGPQPAAFYALAIETGMRKGELCGLRWKNVDLEAGDREIPRTLARKLLH